MVGTRLPFCLLKADNTGTVQGDHHAGDQHQLQHDAGHSGEQRTGQKRLHGKGVAGQAQQQDLGQAPDQAAATMAVSRLMYSAPTPRFCSRP